MQYILCVQSILNILTLYWYGHFFIIFFLASFLCSLFFYYIFFFFFIYLSRSCFLLGVIEALGLKNSVCLSGRVWAGLAVDGCWFYQISAVLWTLLVASQEMQECSFDSSAMGFLELGLELGYDFEGPEPLTVEGLSERSGFKTYK